MRKKLGLIIKEYCSEDDTCTVKGTIPGEMSLKDLQARALEITDKVIFMKGLAVLVVMIGQATVHIHKDGELVVNGVASIDEAEKILEKIL